MSSLGDTHGSIEKRFWRKVDKRDITECWEWKGGLDRRGYGKMGEGPKGGRTLATHRVSWVLHFGDLPNGMFVCHHCDNPKCVNPTHLFLGTHTDNMQDCKKKDRNQAKHRHRLYKVTPEIFERIFELRKKGLSHQKISNETGIVRQHIGDILAGKHWLSHAKV